MQVVNAGLHGPTEGVGIEVVAIVVSDQIRKSNNDTPVIDRRGGIPARPAEIADFGWSAVFPNDGVLGAEIAHAILADTDIPTA